MSTQSRERIIRLLTNNPLRFEQIVEKTGLSNNHVKYFLDKIILRLTEEIPIRYYVDPNDNQNRSKNTYYNRSQQMSEEIIDKFHPPKVCELASCKKTINLYSYKKIYFNKGRDETLFFHSKNCKDKYLKEQSEKVQT